MFNTSYEENNWLIFEQTEKCDTIENPSNVVVIEKNVFLISWKFNMLKLNEEIDDHLFNTSL